MARCCRRHRRDDAQASRLSSAGSQSRSCVELTAGEEKDVALRVQCPRMCLVCKHGHAQRTYTLFGFLQNLLPLHPHVSVLQHLAKPCSSLTSHFNQLGRKAPTPECRTPHQTSRLEGLWSEQGTRQLHCFFFAQLGKVLLKDVTWLEMSCTKPNPGS